MYDIWAQDILDRTEKQGECLIFQGYTGGGYPAIKRNGKHYRAHRVVAVAYLGLNYADSKTVVCHACDTPMCVNPKHLWLGTSSENTKDMYQKGRGWQQKKTYCKNGHPFTPENTHIRPKGNRRCIACHNLQKQEGRRLRGTK